MQTEQISIVLADDHAILRKGLIAMLNNYEGLQVLADADNGKELLEKIEALPSPPDVAVLDINMPEMNGFETAEEIKAKWPLVKILALSMYDNEESIIKMLKCGAHGYVLKDVKPDELCNAIRHLKSNQYYYSDLVTGRMLHLAHSTGKEEVSEKEREFLQHACTEMTYKEIAEKMILSPRTIDGYRESLFKKLNITSRVGLAIYAIRTGLVKV
jgi:two-component system, NarL family, invasion response regulator UvrY